MLVFPGGLSDLFLESTSPLKDALELELTDVLELVLANVFESELMVFLFVNFSAFCLI